MINEDFSDDDFVKDFEKFLPTLSDNFKNIKFIQDMIFLQINYNTYISPNLRVFYMQVSNEFSLFLSALATGNGRSAIRIARSLLEYSVSILEIRDDPRLLDVYSDHFNKGVSILKGIGFEQYLLGENKVHFNSYVNELESGVDPQTVPSRTSWTDINFRQRCISKNMEDEYAFFSFYSSISHGSASSALGNISKENAKYSDFRSGSSPVLAPIAMWGGVKYFISFLCEFEKITQSDLGYLKNSCESIKTELDEYYKLIVDREKFIKTKSNKDKYSNFFTTAIKVDKWGTSYYLTNHKKAYRSSLVKISEIVKEEVDKEALILNRSQKSLTIYLPGAISIPIEKKYICHKAFIRGAEQRIILENDEGILENNKLN